MNSPSSSRFSAVICSAYNHVHAAASSSSYRAEDKMSHLYLGSRPASWLRLFAIALLAVASVASAQSYSSSDTTEISTAALPDAPSAIQAQQQQQQQQQQPSQQQQQPATQKPTEP